MEVTGGGKDTRKRKSRNMSEKKRRDQFNMLVNDLCSMVSKNKKMDKTTVLKSAIVVIKNHKELTDKLKSYEIKEDWKPPFMTNNEFATLMLEAIDGFLMVITLKGTILYTSESVTPLLGYLPETLSKRSLCDILHSSDRAKVYNMLNNHTYVPSDSNTPDFKKHENQVKLVCHMRCDTLQEMSTALYERVVVEGNFRKWSEGNADGTCDICLCCTVKLQQAQMIRELPSPEKVKKEFTSRHSLEWKFLFLDHRGPPVIGYLPFEVLGTSGYDYIHPDDLETLCKCHEQLMQSGEGKSCYYRFLTKGQQWIWLQTRSFISYHQWNSKPEFVVCTNTVVSYAEVKNQDSKVWNESGDVAAKTEMITDQVSTSSTWIDNAQEQDMSEQPDTVSGVAKDAESTVPKKDMSTISLSTLKTLKSEIVRNLVSGQKNPGKLKKTLERTHQLQTRLKMRAQMDLFDKNQDKSTEQQQQLLVEMSTKKQCEGPSGVKKSDVQPKLHNAIGMAAQGKPDVTNRLSESPNVESSAHTGDQNKTSALNSSTEVIADTQPIVMNPVQQQLHLQLLEKHQQLQAAIIRQQQELQKISNQLLVASGIAKNPAVTALLQSQNVINSQIEMFQLPQMGLPFIQPSMNTSTSYNQQQNTQTPTHNVTPVQPQQQQTRQQSSLLQFQNNSGGEHSLQSQMCIQQPSAQQLSPNVVPQIHHTGGAPIQHLSPIIPMHQLPPTSVCRTYLPPTFVQNDSSQGSVIHIQSSLPSTFTPPSHFENSSTGQSPAGNLQQPSFVQQDQLHLMSQQQEGQTQQEQRGGTPSTNLGLVQSNSAVALAQPSHSPIDLNALNQDPMINSVGGQAFDLMHFNTGNQQEPTDFKMFESL